MHQSIDVDKHQHAPAHDDQHLAPAWTCFRLRGGAIRFQHEPSKSVVVVGPGASDLEIRRRLIAAEGSIRRLRGARA